MGGDDDFYPSVKPIGQSDAGQKAPDIDPNYSNLGAPRKEEDSSGQGKGASLGQLADHVYQLAKRGEEDANAAREGHKGMEEEIKRLYHEEEANAGSARPQLLPEPEQPDLSPTPLPIAMAHVMMAIPQALFGGTTKYNPGGALHGLNNVLQDHKNGRPQGTIAQRLALYREQVNIVHQQNEQILKQYEDVLRDKREDIHTKLEAIRTLADVYKDQNTSNMAALEDFDKMISYLQKSRKMLEDTDKNVYSTMDEFNKAVGAGTIEDRAWVSEGAAENPDLADDLESMDKQTKGRARHELERRKPFYKWKQDIWDREHPSEVQQRKLNEEQAKGKTPAPDTPSDDMKKKIQDMDPSLLFGTPKPEATPKQDRRSKSEQLGYNPRRPFDKPQTTSDE